MVADNPHIAAPVVSAGAALDRARACAILLCGRDQETDFMLAVAARVALDDVGYLVLEAAGRSWYPGRYRDPPETNEPWLTWSLGAVDAAVDRVVARGLPPTNIVLCGFSQGACIVAEYAARRPLRYGGVAVLTGALMGPDAASRPLVGSLAGVPVFLGTSRLDDWVDLDWVEAARAFFERAGACVELRVYDDPEHHVNDDEVSALRDLMSLQDMGGL